MYRAKVKATLPGTLSLPSVGTRAYKPGDDVYMTPEQYWQQDVQSAFKKGALTLEVGSPKATKMQTVTNVTDVSLILPVYGCIRSKQSTDIKIDDLQVPDINRLLVAGKLVKGKPKAEKDEETDDAVENKPIVVKKKAQTDEIDESKLSPVDQKMKAVVYKPKKAETELSEAFVDLKKSAGKKKGVKAKHITDNDLLIDVENGVEPGEKDGIQFVDVEQTEERIQQHPTLRKFKNE